MHFVRQRSLPQGTNFALLTRRGFTMSILVDCPGHGGSLHLPDDTAGKKVRCPRCQTIFTVPGTVRPVVMRKPIPRPTPAESETMRDTNTKSSITTPDRRRPRTGAADRSRQRIDSRRRPNVTRNSSGQMLVGGMIVGCLVAIVVLAVGGVFLALRAKRSSGGQVARPADRRAERDKQEPWQLKGPNLLVNGGFEEGPMPVGAVGFQPLNEGSTAIRGWTVTRGSIDSIDSYWQHAEGQRSLDLNGMVRGGIAQTIRTTKGQRYRVTFSMAGNPNQAEGMGVKTLGITTGESNASFAFDTTGRTNFDMGWMIRTWDFVATAEHTTIEFYSLSGQSCGPTLDNVSVVALE